jgi:two-component system, chemotaxis family, CheB/CheR fusion protein
MSGATEIMVPGVSFEEVIRARMDGGYYADGSDTIEDWIQERLERHRNPCGPFEVRLADDRLIEVNEFKTKESGTTVIRTDITERKRAEEKLRQSETRLFQIIEHSPMACFISRKSDGVVLVGNTRFAEMWGLAEGEIVGCDTRLFQPDEKERDINVAHVEKHGFLRSYESRRVRRDGTEFWILGSLYPFTYEGEEALLGWSYDITERKHIERQLLHAQKMEAVGHLTGGIAHDFNNLLQVIAVNSGLARFDIEEDGTISGFLDLIEKAVAHGSALTQQLLAFSRGQTLFPRTVDPNGLIEGMLKILGRTLGEDIEIKTSLEADIPSIAVDPNALESAVLNLAINARAAMPEGGELTVMSGRRRLDDGLVTEDDVLPAGDYVEISLTDTGCGMPPEVLARVIEPFFTTREVGEGSGLGLSMVYGFAEQSGGRLFLESAPAKGTTASIFLPIAEEAAEAVGEAPRKAEPRGSVGTVLVVEDDPDVRATVVALLETFGHEVREAGDATTALEVLREDSGVNILFTDVVMPKGMNGFQLAKEASRRYPGLRVLLTSGYPEIELEKTGLGESDFTLLKKPFSPRELTDALSLINGT